MRQMGMNPFLKAYAMTQTKSLIAIAVMALLPTGALAQTAQPQFQVVELDGQPFAAKAMIGLPVDGRIEGQGPCNRFFAEVTDGGAGLTIGPVGATKMACPDLRAEAALFQTLAEIVRIEPQADGTVIFFDDKGPRIVVKPAA